MSSITTTHPLSEEVVRFCQSGTISWSILKRRFEDCRRNLSAHGAAYRRYRIRSSPNPEVENEDTVVIDMWFIHGSVDEGLSRKAEFTRHWIANVPANVVGQIVLLHYLT